MIQRIGIIYQDVYSRGFLEGLKLRLTCKAAVVRAEGFFARSKHMKPRDARKACRFLLGKNVDMIVRFTDADGADWQDVKRRELEAFPVSVRAILVIGVAVNNPEEWLARAPHYLARELGIEIQALASEPAKASLIKGAIDRARRPLEKSSDVVARLVNGAPQDAFKQWLGEDSFREFYSECRRIATYFECETTNEL